jgi:hypothetical protein
VVSNFDNIRNAQIVSTNIVFYGVFVVIICITPCKEVGMKYSDRTQDRNIP